MVLLQHLCGSQQTTTSQLLSCACLWFLCELVPISDLLGVQTALSTTGLLLELGDLCCCYDLLQMLSDEVVGHLKVMDGGDNCVIMKF